MPGWSTKALVLKLSCHKVAELAENSILEAAYDAARSKLEESRGVFNHLLALFYYEDVDLNISATLGHILGDGEWCEKWVLSLSILEELRPMTEITSSAALAEAYWGIFYGEYHYISLLKIE